MEDTKRAAEAQDNVQFSTSEEPVSSSNIMITAGETLVATDREARAAAVASVKNETFSAPTGLMTGSVIPPPPPPPEPLVADPSSSSQSASGRTNSDGAPRRFKSAFIIFSSMRHKEIKKELLEKGAAKKTTDIAKMVSQEWREMESSEKAVWEEKSREDKERYEAEKARFKIQRPSKQGGKRILKDPDAPKRPMSAFLAFSNQRRAELKRKNPQATNADLSKMLSKQWKELDPEAKNKYVEEEARLRKKYKGDIATWRRKKAAETKATRKKQEAAAVKAMQEREVVNRQGDGTGMQSAEQAGVGSALFNPYGAGGAFSQFQAQSLSGARMGNPLFAGGQDMRGGLAGAEALGAGNMFFQEQMARNAAAQHLLAQHLLGQQFLPQQAYLGNINPMALQGQQPQNMPNQQQQQQQGVFPIYMQQPQQQPQQQGATDGSHDMNDSANRGPDETS